MSFGLQENIVNHVISEHQNNFETINRINLSEVLTWLFLD